jgi:hypothetical protein
MADALTGMPGSVAEFVGLKNIQTYIPKNYAPSTEDAWKYISFGQFNLTAPIHTFIFQQSVQPSIVTAILDGINEIKETLARHEEMLQEIWSEAPREVKTDVLTGGGREFSLREQLNLVIKRENRIVALDSPSLGILAFGKSRALALKSFAEDFAVLWQEIGQEPDGNLTAEARQLKSALVSLVKDIDDIE